MELSIHENLIIDEMELVEEKMKKYLHIATIDFEKIKNFVDKNEHTIFSLNEELKICDIDSKDAKYAWIDTGYGSERDPVFISLIKHHDVFSGHYVGTAKYLATGVSNSRGKKLSQMHSNATLFLKKYFEKTRKHIRERIVCADVQLTNSNRTCCDKTSINTKDVPIAEQIPREEKYVDYEKELSPVTEEIYENLLFPNWHTIKGLDRYIKVIGARICQLVERNMQDFYVKNHLGSVVVNTGLMDSYGRDYLLHYRYHMKQKSYIVYKVISGKKDFVEQGFSKEDASKELKPITFFDSVNERFCATVEEFDLNAHTLRHVIDERRKRFPESIQSESPDILVSRLIVSLERGLKMQMRDPSFVKAIYSGKDKCISWIMPLHVERGLMQEPELVFAIRRVKDFYEVKTVLPYDEDMKDRITATYIYGNVW